MNKEDKGTLKFCPSTLAEYNANPSTKLDALIAIVSHHSTQPGLKPFEPEEATLYKDKSSGTVSPVEIVRSVGRIPDEDPNMPREKIIIYSAWPFLKKLLTSVLALHDFPVATIDGTTTPEKRSKIIHDFQQNGAHKSTDGSNRESHILLLSAVAGTGINLPRATIVIFLVSVITRLMQIYAEKNKDCTWGGGEEEQIIGRAHRYPQAYRMVVYKLLIGGSVDELMCSNASAKTKMLDVVHNRYSRELQNYSKRRMPLNTQQGLRKTTLKR
jgi:SNF2 family DNA or RNA helicase